MHVAKVHEIEKIPKPLNRNRNQIHNEERNNFFADYQSKYQFEGNQLVACHASENFEKNQGWQDLFCTLDWINK